MNTPRWIPQITLGLVMVLLAACDSMVVMDDHAATGSLDVAAKVTLVNGWYEGEEIYYIDRGVEDGVTERGENDIYLIGGNRVYQPQVVEFVPGEAGYSPHWNVYVVHTAEGVTVADIAASSFASDMWASDGLLFDDVEDLRGAEEAGLVIFEEPGVVVNCPLVEEPPADGDGILHASADFAPWPETF